MFKGDNIVGPGPLIAIDVILLYTILGPLVLFGIYVLFDSLDPTGKTKLETTINKDPALWTSEEIDAVGFDGLGPDGNMDSI